GGVALTVLVLVLTTWLLLMRGGLAGEETAALAVGLGIGLLATVAALRWSRRMTVELRALHADAVRQLRDPSGRVGAERSRALAVLASRELADLGRVLDALQRRARVSDEVAEQARRTAENASAGMFELLSGLVAAEEATRGQLSAELHDTVAQS